MEKKNFLSLDPTTFLSLDVYTETLGYRDQSYGRRHTVTAAVLRSAIKEPVNRL